MPQPVAGRSSTGPRPRSGTPNVAPGDPSLPSWRITPRLHDYVQQRLSAEITDEDGNVVGPEVEAFKGRRHGRRKDRRWATSWSPEQISERLKIDFPDDEEMRISHEAIYQALYIQGCGALKRELVACLRTGRALRTPRERTRQSGKRFVTEEVKISRRPAEAEDRAVPGHWEGDLILGTGSSVIGTLVERTTRLTMLLRLPRMPEHGRQPAKKNGPPLAGHGAVAVNEAIAKQIGSLPEQLRKSLAWDQGAEMAYHADLKLATGLSVYCCDPKSPGSVAQTKTPTGCSGSTSHAEPTSHDTS